MTDSTGTLPEFRKVLMVIAQEVSVSRIKTITRGMEFVIEELPADPAPTGVYTVICLLTGKALKMTFRVNFDPETAKNIQAHVAEKPVAELTQEVAADLFKEFSNLVSGGIQKMLQDQSVRTGIGLPLVMTPVMPVPSIFKKTVYDHHWTLKSGENKFYCALSVGVMEQTALENLKIPDFAKAVEDEGSVDFL